MTEESRIDDRSPVVSRSPELWAYEVQTPHRKLGLRVTGILRDETTRYQRLVVVDTVECGRALLLDGAIQLTEADEFMYHEMLVHPALCSLPDAVHDSGLRVLVVGGGDGGTAREVFKHPRIEAVDLVDIDEGVWAASRDFFPSLWQRPDGWRLDLEPRFAAHCEDGFEWALRSAAQGRTYHAILVDSTDPMPGPGAILFSDEFYAALAALVGGEGVVAVQAGSPVCQPEVTARAAQGMARAFGRASLYAGATPTYPSGYWCYAGGSRSGRFGPRAVSRPELARRIGAIEERHGPLRYYNPDVHEGAFALPNFVQELVRPGR